MRWIALLLLGMTLGCQRVDGPLPLPDLTNRKARVVVTIGMIADIVRHVGAEHVEIECLMGPGIDPHRYLPSAGDIQKLRKADIIFYNGLHLEGKMTDLFEDMSHQVRTVPVSRTIPESQLLPADEGAHDPHIWFDVRLWQKAVDVVRDSLMELDPAHQESYRQNAETYQKQLQALHEEVWTKAEKLTKNRRVLITAHDAFHYFGQAYGFDVKGLQGVSTAADTSTSDVRKLVELIGEQRIPVLFGETSIPDRGIQAVQEAVRKDYQFQVRLSQSKLFSDALGEAGSPAGTYIGMVRHNIDTIIAELSR